ncbi:ureidoglycolate lyase, partial [Methylobacterium persicinum]
AFLTAPWQGVCYAPGTWHGVLTPFGQAQDFVVVDRGGAGANLEEFVYDEPWTVALP